MRFDFLPIDRDILEHIYDFDHPEVMEMMVKPSLDETFVVHKPSGYLILLVLVVQKKFYKKKTKLSLARRELDDRDHYGTITIIWPIWHFISCFI